MLAEHRAGAPSAVTAHAAEADIALSDCEIKERMSSRLCRCGAHHGVADAIRAVAVAVAAEEPGPMIPFDQLAAPDVDTAMRLLADHSDARVIGSGTNLVDLYAWLCQVHLAPR